ncbi:MAG: hypothetical protein ACOC2W_01090 [bacterium]
MNKRYYKFCKSHFEYELNGILIRNRAGFLTEITEDWREEGNETWEYIYKISTKNRAVDIIVFSSIDLKTDEVRDIGGDAVRLVMRWRTRSGNVFKRLAKHYRIKTLFENMEKTILEAQKSVFNLNYNNFYNKPEEVV